MHYLKITLIILSCILFIYSEISFLKSLSIFVLILVCLYLFLLVFMKILNQVLFPNTTHNHIEKNENQNLKSIPIQLFKTDHPKVNQEKITIIQQFQIFKKNIYTQLDSQNQAYLDEIEMIFLDIEQRKKSSQFNISKKLNRKLRLAENECLKQIQLLFDHYLDHAYNNFDQQTFIDERNKIIEKLLKKIEFLYQNDLQSLLNHQYFIQQNLDVKPVFELKQNTKRIWQNDE